MPEILGKQIGSGGYGLMGLTWRSVPIAEEQSFEAMIGQRQQFREFYGPPDLNSLTLLEKYFTKYPEDADKFLIGVKGGLKYWQPDGSPEDVRTSVDNCLKLLNGKKLDIFECARMDKNTPLETTLKVLDEEYVKTGKIGGISLCEVSADTIERAVKLCKIIVVEVEVSLGQRASSLMEWHKLAHAIIYLLLRIYSPIGRGMLTGKITKPEDIPKGDFRQTLPRFQKENFGKNLELVCELENLAKTLRCTPAQLAISWVRGLSRKDSNPEITPIPGSATVERVNENAKCVPLSKEDLAEIYSILQSFEVVGTRYGGHSAAFMEG